MIWFLYLICIYATTMSFKLPMRESRNFRQGGGGGGGGGAVGGPGQSDKRSSDNVFFVFVFFLVLSLFCRSQMVNFKENYHFSRFQRVSNFFQGGGGSNCFFPIETHITWDFPGGGCPDPLSPPWIRTCCLLN